MAEIKSKAPSSELVQAPLFGSEPPAETSFHWQVDAKPEIPNNSLKDTGEISSNGYISGGNELSKPRLGMRDLTDLELAGAYETLTPQQQRNFEDQGLNASVRIERETKDGNIVAKFLITDINSEIDRRAEEERLRNLTGHEASSPKKKNKKPNTFWREYMEDKNKYLTPRIRSGR